MNVAIIPAAGSGSRFGGQTPKQFIEIAGAPVLAHTIGRFIDCYDIDTVVTALPEDALLSFPDKLSRCRLFESKSSIETDGSVVISGKRVIFVAGGMERSDSILNGLESVAGLNPEIVAVHDAVRPFVTPDQISAVVRKACKVGAAILALPSTDTIKEVEEGVIIRTLDRGRIWRAQTPQAFRFVVLMRANKEAKAAGISSSLMTDDSLLVERLGLPVAVVEGSVNNIKITSREDLLLAERLFERGEE